MQSRGEPVDHPKGYIVAIAICMVQLGVFGVLNSFSVFVKNMSEDESLGKPSIASLSFGNSVAVGMSPVIGVFIGGLVDRFGPRVMIILSALAMTLGSILGSLLATSPLTLVLSYSILGSFSSALMTSPGVVSVGSWFEKQRAFAMGIAYAGGGAGSCIVPVVAGWLIETTNDWRASFRYLSLFMLLPAAAAAVVTLRKPPQEELLEEGEADEPARLPTRVNGSDGTNSEAADLSKVKNESDLLVPAKPASRTASGLSNHVDEYGIIEFEDMHFAHRRQFELLPFKILLESIAAKDFITLFLVSTGFGFAFFGVLFVTVPYAQEMGKKGSAFEGYEEISTEKATTLLSLFGIAEIIGSVVLGYFAARLNNRYAYIMCCGVAGVSFGFFAISRQYTDLAIAIFFVGLAQAGAFAILPALIVDHFDGPNAGTYVGLNFCSFAVGGFAGGPVCTSLAQANNGDWTVSICLLGFTSVVSGAVATVLVPHRKLSTEVEVRSPASTRHKSGLMFGQ